MGSIDVSYFYNFSFYRIAKGSTMAEQAATVAALKFTLNDVPADGWFDILKPEEGSEDVWSIQAAYRTDAALTSWLDTVDKTVVPQAEYYSDTAIIIKADFEKVSMQDENGDTVDITLPYDGNNFLIVDLNASNPREDGNINLCWHRLAVNPNGGAISFGASALIDA